MPQIDLLFFGGFHHRSDFNNPGAHGPSGFCVDFGTKKWYYVNMKRKHRKTLELIFARPVTGGVKWSNIEALFVSLGAKMSEREGLPDRCGSIWRNSGLS